MIERAQTDFESSNVATDHDIIGRREHEVRRSQERHERRGAESRRNRGEDEVECCREGFGGKRQRLAQLDGHAARREDFACEIDIGQRPADDDGGAIERNVGMEAVQGPDAPHDIGQFVFAIPAGEAERITARRNDQRRRDDRAVAGRHAHFLELGEQAMQPLEQSGCQLPFGRQNLERLEIRQAREQVEVGRRQAVDVMRRLTNRDDRGPDTDVAMAWRADVNADGARREGRTTRRDVRSPERGGEEPRLAKQAFRTRIVLRCRLERRDQQAREVVHRLPVASQRVVEVQHFADQGGTQIERRRGAFRDRLVRGSLHQHLALEDGEQARQRAGPLVQSACTSRAASADRAAQSWAIVPRPASNVRRTSSAADRVGNSTTVDRAAARHEATPVRSDGLEGREARARGGAGFVGA